MLHKYRDLYSKVRMLTALGTVNCLKCEKLADGEYQWYKEIAKDRVSVKMLAYKVVFIKVLLLLYADWLFKLLLFLKRITLRKRNTF